MAGRRTRAPLQRVERVERRLHRVRVLDRKLEQRRDEVLDAHVALLELVRLERDALEEPLGLGPLEDAQVVRDVFLPRLLLQKSGATASVQHLGDCEPIQLRPRQRLLLAGTTLLQRPAMQDVNEEVDCGGGGRGWR